MRSCEPAKVSFTRLREGWRGCQLKSLSAQGQGLMSPYKGFAT